MILEREGYAVSAARGLEEATRACAEEKTFDLILLGHSIPRREKEKILPELKKRCAAPVLSIRNHTEPPVTGAEFSVDSHDGPEALIKAVKTATKS
jgi:DNA-binding NtrC family response regulator